MVSVRRLIQISYVFMMLLFAGAIAIIIGREWRDLKTLEKASQAATVVSVMSSATIELSLERSLTQVAANLDTPIAPQIKKMLMDQRQKSNALFAETKEKLLASPAIDDRAQIAAQLEKYLAEIETLRRQADSLLRVGIDQRKPAQIQSLPKNIKKMVSSLDALLSDIRLLMSSAPNDIISTDLVVQRAWMIREYGGRERTLFAIATARKEPLSRADIAYMHTNHGKALQAWEAIEKISKSDHLSSEVKAGIATLGQSYFNDYELLRRDLIAQSESAAYSVDFGTLFQRSEAALQKAIRLLEIA